MIGSKSLINQPARQSQMNGFSSISMTSKSAHGNKVGGSDDKLLPRKWNSDSRKFIWLLATPSKALEWIILSRGLNEHHKEVSSGSGVKVLQVIFSRTGIDDMPM